MKSLATSLCDIAPPAQLKRKNDNKSSRSKVKRKKKRVTVATADDETVRFSDAGMDFLANGLVRCQTCHLTWDKNTSYKCLCGIYYNGSDQSNLNTTTNRQSGLDFLENGLVRCQACYFE